MGFGNSCSARASEAATVVVMCCLGLLVAGVASLPSGAAQNQNPELANGTQVKIGVTVLKGYMRAHLNRIPALDTICDDQALYKAMYSLSVMEQYVRMIGSLNLTSQRLDFFADVMEQILSDSCLWINSLDATRDYPAIDCNDQADFIPTLLALGLRPFIEESSSYLTDRYPSSSNAPGAWIQRAVGGEDHSAFCGIAGSTISGCST